MSGDEIYPSYTYETGSSPALRSIFGSMQVDVHERIRPLWGALIVDIGSNDGTMLRYFTDMI